MLVGEFEVRWGGKGCGSWVMGGWATGGELALAALEHDGIKYPPFNT